MEKLPDKIRTLRSVYGYSQEYLAFQLGISQAAYSKKETGQTQPSLIDLQQIVVVYGISIADLLQLSISELLQLSMANGKKKATT
jgi:transcriptional regulator with XRE-family HTH domain